MTAIASEVHRAKTVSLHGVATCRHQQVNKWKRRTIAIIQARAPARKQTRVAKRNNKKTATFSDLYTCSACIPEPVNLGALFKLYSTCMHAYFPSGQLA